MMDKMDRYDDEVTIIGGSEWKPDSPGNGTRDRSETSSGLKRWKAIAAVSVTVPVLLACFLIGRHLFFMARFPKARPDSEIIQELSSPARFTVGAPGIHFNTASSMGVPLKIYEIEGLYAHFADTVPDYSDSSIFLITRSADYRVENDRRIIIGDFIQEGKTLSKSTWRAGFMAINGGKAQIGISRNGKVRRFVQKHGGSFFRQLAIVSAGTRCDEQFILKGKVSRCAYARDESGRLCFVETVNPETLYGFADALIEYGFIDAVYVTGGTQPELFYRDSCGTAHGRYTDDKPHKLVIWTRLPVTAPRESRP